MHKGFIGHGVFVEGNPIGTLSRYKGYKTSPSMLERLMSMLPDALRPSPDPVALIGKFVEAMNDMTCSWTHCAAFDAAPRAAG